jgi:hypothetical protein
VQNVGTFGTWRLNPDLSVRIRPVIAGGAHRLGRGAPAGDVDEPVRVRKEVRAGQADGHRVLRERDFARQLDQRQVALGPML